MMMMIKSLLVIQKSLSVMMMMIMISLGDIKISLDDDDDNNDLSRCLKIVVSISFSLVV